MLRRIATFHLVHQHEPDACRAAFAAWKGFCSPLRGGTTLASCHQGGHELFWTVEAASAEAALALLPPFVAERTRAIEVAEEHVP